MKSHTQSFAMLTLIKPLRKFSLALKTLLSSCAQIFRCNTEASCVQTQTSSLRRPEKLLLKDVCSCAAAPPPFFFFFSCLFLFLKQPAKTHLAIECKAAGLFFFFLFFFQFSELRRLCFQ